MVWFGSGCGVVWFGWLYIVTCRVLLLGCSLYCLRSCLYGLCGVISAFCVGVCVFSVVFRAVWFGFMQFVSYSTCVSFGVVW